MDIFGASANINPNEFNRLKTSLRNKGFSDAKIRDIEQVFQGDMFEGNGNTGIDMNEVRERMKWFRTNKSKHNLSAEQINILEEELMSFL